MSDDQERILLESGISLQGAIDDMKRLRQTLLAAAKQQENDLAASAGNAAKLMSRAQLQAALSTKSHADQVKLLDEQITLARVNTTRYYNLQTQRAKAQAAADRDEAAATKRQIADAAKFTNEKLKQEQAERRLALVSADRTQKLKILNDALEQQTKGSVQYLKIQEQIARVEKQGNGGGPLPRTFAGFAGSGALQLAGALGLVTSLTQGLQELNEQANKGVEINASIDGNRRALGAFLNDVERGNNVFQRASQYGREYGFTQEQIAEATRGASSIIKNSTADVEKILEVQSRLQTASPEQSLSEASLAIKELASGDIQSIVRRFEIARSTANRWKQEITDGADVIDVLDRGLNELGITQSVVEQRTEGLIGAQNRARQATEDWDRALGNLKQNSGWQQIATDITNVATRAIGGEIPNSENDEIIRASGNYQAYRELLQARIQSYVLMGQTSKARELEISLLTKEQFATRQLALAQQAAIEARQELTKQGSSGVSGAYDATPLDVLGRASQVLETDIARLNIEIAKQQLEIKRATAALAPYEQAVTDAAQANEDAKKGLADAEAERDKWRGAQIEGEKALSDQLFAIGQERAQAELDLLNFRTGGGLDAELEPYRDALSDAKDDTQGFVDAQKAAESAVDDAQSVYDAAQDSLRGYDDAVDSAKRGLDDQKEALDSANDYLDEQNQILKETEQRYQNVTNAIEAQQGAINDWKSGPLIGDRADRERLQAYDDQLNSIDQLISRRKLAGADRDDKQLQELEKRRDRVQEEQRLAQLEIEATRGRQRRELEDLARSREQENSYGDAQQGITSGLNETERLQRMYGAHQDAIDAQKEVVAEAQAAVDAQETVVKNAEQILKDATEAQRLQNIQVENAKIALDNQKQALQDANEALSDQKQRVNDLETALKDAEENALKPFTQAVQDASDKASKVDLEGELKFGPLRKLIDEAGKSVEEFPFQVLLDGVNESEKRVAEWRTRVAETTTNLDLAKDALERQKKPIEDQQARLDELNLRLDATKIDLQEINKAQDEYVEDAPKVQSALETNNPLYATFATNTEAIARNLLNMNNAALAAQNIPIPPIWSIPSSGYGAGGGGGKVNPAMLRGSGYDPASIDQILHGTGLQGQGSLIAYLSKEYNIPAELALAMFRKEASFLTAGSSVANNNPGNIVYTGGAYGEDRRGDDGRFGHYATVADGIEAYFKLLDKEYRQFIDNGDIEGLINKYAPGFENDTPLYIRQVREWMTQYLQSIIGAAAGDPTYTRGSKVDTAGDPVLSDQAVDTVLPGGHQNDGYNSWRDEPDYVGPHYGLDIGGTEGMDVLSPVNGRVTFAAPNKHGGTAVIIEDDQGREWYFGHLRDDIDVGQGDQVNAGQVLGQISRTFNHTHLQLKDAQGQLQDPSAILEAIARYAEGSGPGAGDWYGQQSTYGTGDPSFANLLNLPPDKMQALIAFFERIKDALPDYRYGDTPFAPVLSDLAELADYANTYTTGDPDYSLFPPIGDQAEEQLGRAKVALDGWEERWAAFLRGDTPADADTTGPSATSGDPSAFGKGGGMGGGYGYSDPTYGSVIGDPMGLGDAITYGITDPVADAIATVGDDTQTLHDLFAPSAWSQTNEDVRMTWELNRDYVIEPWRTAIDYVRSGADLIHRLAAEARLDAETVKNAAGSGGGGGGNASGSGGPTTTIYQTNNFRTESQRTINGVMSARGINRG